MENLQIINEQEVLGKDFKVYGTFDEPLFLAKDVAEWIEHSDVSMMLKNIDNDEKLIQTMFVSGQNRDCMFLTENGLYEVLMLSRKPVAKQFKTEVKKILKGIRKTGSYTVIPTRPKEEIALEERKAKLQEAEFLKNYANDYREKYETYAEIIDAYAIKTVVGEFLLPLPKTEKTYTASEIAKELNVSANQVGKIANSNNLKTDEYGIFVLDKSKYSAKEVQTFRYNEKGKNRIKELLAM